MKFWGVAVVAAIAATTANSAMAEEPPGLAPSTPWTLDYDTDSCALRRTFGEGDDRAYLELRRFQPGLSLQVIVASNRMKANNPADIRYRFQDDGEWNEFGRAPSLSLADGFSGVIFRPELVELPEEYEDASDSTKREAYLKTIDVKAMERDAAARTNTFELRGAFRRRLALQIGSMEQPIEALNTCIDELMTHWNIDVEAHKSLTRSATPINMAEVPGMISYPPKMIRQLMPGIVNVRLSIDEHGGITGCHIQMPLSDPAFEESSCADVQHALEFEPALDKDGKPIASYWVTAVIFRIR